MKLYLRVHRGAKLANERLKGIGYVLEKKDKELYASFHTAGVAMAGPLWLGELCDPEFADHICKNIDHERMKMRIRELVSLLPAEGITPFFYTSNELASISRSKPKPINYTLEKLRAMGYSASKTHFNPSGIKTDSPYETLLNL